MTEKIKSEDFIKAFGSGVGAKVENIPMKMEIGAGKCPIEAGGNCPLRPQGEWVEAEITEEYRQYGFDLRVVCSRCGSEQSYFDFNEYHEPIAVTYIRSRFCSYCGAKMIKDFTGEAIP